MAENCVEVAKRQSYIPEKKNAAEAILEAFCDVSFVVYGRCVSKKRPRVVNNHAYTPKDTAEQENKIKLVYRSIYHDFMFEKDVPLKLSADFYFEIPRSDSKIMRAEKMDNKIKHTKKPDADNLLKLVLDAVNGVAYYDDSQVIEVTGRKFYSDKPRTEIRIQRVL